MGDAFLLLKILMDNSLRELRRKAWAEYAERRANMASALAEAGPLNELWMQDAGEMSNGVIDRARVNKEADGDYSVMAEIRGNEIVVKQLERGESDRIALTWSEARDVGLRLLELSDELGTEARQAMLEVELQARLNGVKHDWAPRPESSWGWSSADGLLDYVPKVGPDD